MNFNVNAMRVAKPCSMSWDSMAGNERVRSCDLCRHNVYNTAGMTKREIEQLVRTREGRLCVRLYRRSDGTLLTSDCPVGVRNYARRVGRLASAAAALVFGLFGATYGQKAGDDDKKNQVKVTIEQVQDAAGVKGIVMDPIGAVIPDACIDIYAGDVGIKSDGSVKPIMSLLSDAVGAFRVKALAEGVYTVAVKAPMMKTSAFRKVTVKKGTIVDLQFNLDLGVTYITVGLLDMSEPLIDMSSNTVQTRIVRGRPPFPLL